MKSVTFVYPYYENPAFLAHQVECWSRYAEELRERLSIVIVDDCSPLTRAALVVGKYRTEQLRSVPIRVFRIDVDVRWNWLAARNIGAHYAPDGWMLLTDMDHVVPERTLRSLMSNHHDPKTIYRFSRTGTKTTPHPNSWFVTREMFWKIGGYDESASGYYGTDGDYRRRCAATAPVVILPEMLEHHEFEQDASTEIYKRKQSEDAEGKRILRARRGLAPKVLSFPYHEVML